MTDVPPQTELSAEPPVPAEPAAPADELVNRLAAVELRLRLVETADPAATAVDADEVLGLLRPPTTSSAAPTIPPDLADPLDERAMARSEWATEALQVLTESLVRARAQIADTQARLEETTARFGARLAVETARSQRLADVLARTYSQAQGVQEVVRDLQASRSYRLGHRLARLAGRPGPGVTRYATPIAEDIDPFDVALVAGSGLFDAEWYLTTYPDIAAAGADPLAHFMTQARPEQRCPGPLFDTGWYLGEYGPSLPDEVNPLVHYLTDGWRQGYRPWATFDPEDYLRQHPEIAGLDVCPLLHLAAASAG